MDEPFYILSLRKIITTRSIQSIEFARDSALKYNLKNMHILEERLYRFDRFSLIYQFHFGGTFNMSRRNDINLRTTACCTCNFVVWGLVGAKQIENRSYLLRSVHPENRWCYLRKFISSLSIFICLTSSQPLVMFDPTNSSYTYPHTHTHTQTHIFYPLSDSQTPFLRKITAYRIAWSGLNNEKINQSTDQSLTTLVSCEVASLSKANE